MYEFSFSSDIYWALLKILFVLIDTNDLVLFFCNDIALWYCEFSRENFCCSFKIYAKKWDGFFLLIHSFILQQFIFFSSLWISCSYQQNHWSTFLHEIMIFNINSKLNFIYKRMIKEPWGETSCMFLTFIVNILIQCHSQTYFSSIYF